jgi:hypothetical protein
VEVLGRGRVGGTRVCHATVIKWGRVSVCLGWIRREE